MSKKKMDFEASLDKISEISEQLEKEEMKLDDSMNLYKEAMTLINSCKNQLEKAEREIYILREKINDDDVDSDKINIESKKEGKSKQKVKSNKKDKDISFELFSDIEILEKNED